MRETLGKISRDNRQHALAAEVRANGGHAHSEQGVVEPEALAMPASRSSRAPTPREDQLVFFEALAHDLRTPLSRVKLAASFVPDVEISHIIRSSVDEIEDMLRSVQRFQRALHLEDTAELVDLRVLIGGLLTVHGERARCVAPDEAHAITFPEVLSLALTPLIKNALQYGSQVLITIRSAPEGWWIDVADDGPGISEQHFEAVLYPFFRGDAARARDTSGFGLGIPTAHRLLRRFGGAIAFGRSAGGGAVVSVRVPGPGA